MLKFLCITGLLFCHSILNGQQINVNKSFAEDTVDLLDQIEQQLLANPSGSLYFQKGKLLKERFDYPGSLSAVTMALEYDSTNTVYLSELADIHISLGNNPDAVSVLRKALSFHPEDTNLKGKLGKLLMNLQDYKNAYNAFTELKAIDSTNLFFNKQLALSSAYLGKNQEATKLFRYVLDLNPRDYGSYLSLVSLLQQDTAYAEADQVLKKALGQFPGNGGLLLKEAQNYYMLEKYAQAVADYEVFLEKNDTLPNTRKEYGVCLYLSKKEEKALKILEPLLYLAPNDPIVAMYVGLCYKNLKDFDQAKIYLRLASELAIPGYLSGIYQSLGQVHGMQREFPLAIAMYKKAYELDDQNHELLFEMATTYEEYDSDKTVAYQYYKQYLKKAGDKALNASYATSRMTKIKEKLFFGE